MENIIEKRNPKENECWNVSSISKVFLRPCVLDLIIKLIKILYNNKDSGNCLGTLAFILRFAAI